MTGDITTIFYPDTLPYSHKGRAVALGFFDGIHLGHKQIIRKTVKEACLQDLTSTVITFTNFRKGENGLLTTVEEKREILSGLGVDELLVLDFDEVKNMSAEDFLNEIIKVKLSARALFAGSDYRFGKNASGDAAMLQRFGDETSTEVTIFEPVGFGEQNRRLSSTWLREVVNDADMELYSSLTGGTNFSYQGKVLHGKELGRRMGTPTANIEVPEEKIKARFGVYVSRIILGSRKLYGVTNVGMRPSVDDGGTVNAETFIFDFDDDIYGARIKVELLGFIRPEVRFDSIEALSRQIASDKESAKTWLVKRGIINRI